MPRLWVANATKQKINFRFRVPEIPSPKEIAIPIGAQVQVWTSDMSTQEADYIIAQLEAGYGAVRADAIDRTRVFTGVCYSIDKPVPAQSIVRAVKHNDEVLTKQGEETRKQAAVAIHDTLSQAGVREGDLAETTVAVEEIPARGGEVNVKQSIHVAREGERPTRSRKKKGN